MKIQRQVIEVEARNINNMHTPEICPSNVLGPGSLGLAQTSLKAMVTEIPDQELSSVEERTASAIPTKERIER